MTVLRRGAGTALAAFIVGRESWSATSTPLIRRRFSSRLLDSLLFSPADPMLLDGSDAAVLDAVGGGAYSAAVMSRRVRRRLHLCHSVKWIIQAAKDKKIKFCCLHSKAADEPYVKVSGVGRDDVLCRFLFVEGPGLYHQGSAAGLRALSYLPSPYSASSSLMIIPIPLRDVVYDYIAK